MESTPKVRGRISRRGLFTGAAATAAVGGVTALGFTWPAMASASEDGHGLTIVESDENDGRLQYYRFATEEIEWDPAVNILLPEGYHDSGKTYPVLYMLHGGNGQFSDFVDAGMEELTAGSEVIVVMPDASCAWYSNPVTSNTGPHNWETFHMQQLLPWVDDNFRTHAEFDGRSVAGFSMGGFGAMKYAAKYHGHFCSVSAHSGPTSLRRDAGIVVHWANTTAATIDLGGGMVYGAPWDEARVDADNPMQNIDRYADKRIFMCVGDSPEPLDLFSQINEAEVMAGQREFGAALSEAGIEFDAREESGGHVFRPEVFADDLAGMLERMRAAE